MQAHTVGILKTNTGMTFVYFRLGCGDYQSNKQTLLCLKKVPIVVFPGYIFACLA